MGDTLAPKVMAVRGRHSALAGSNRWLEVDDRRPIDSLQTIDLEAFPFDSEHCHWVQADGVGTVRRAGAEDPALGTTGIVAGHGRELVTACQVQPGQLVEVGDITRFPTKAHFASWNGTAPVDASSGDQVRHRLSRGGNRQINRVLHIMARVQIRNPSEDRAYYDRKKADGKAPMEAIAA